MKSLPPSPLSLTTTSLALLALLPLAASASQLLSESFDYPAGDLTTVSGGIWSDLNTLGTGESRVVTTPGLTFDNLTVAGNQVTYTGTTFGNSRASGVSTSFEQGGTYYASALFTADDAGWGQGAPVIGVSLSSEANVGGNNGLAFGLLGNVDGGNNIRPFVSVERLDQTAAVLTDATPTGAVGSTDLTPGATYLLVAKWVVTDAANNTADLFLNVYDLAAGVPTTESYTITLSGAVYGWPMSGATATLDNLGIYKYNTDGVGSVDEIRYGTSWANVLPTATEPPVTTTPTIAANRLPQGGGIIYPAWSAAYFNNATLAGDPVWERSEIRIRFDWEDWRPIIGSRSEKLYDHHTGTWTFPTDQFSARWTGQLKTRFSETYTFHLLSDEGVRLQVKPATASTWTTVIDAWAPHARRTDSGSFDFIADTVYDIQIEYYDLTGDAVCELRWESPSTPLEVLDYLGSTSIHTEPQLIFANHFRGWIDSNATRDAQGWPTSDFNALLNANRPGYGGRHLLSFRGLAQVTVNGATFHVGGTTYTDQVPSGVGYDPATNTTRMELDYTSDTGDSPRYLRMDDTQRTPADPLGSGVTEVHLMKPRFQGATEAQGLGEMANGEWREVVLPYISFRLQATGLDNYTLTWTDRCYPGGAYYQRGAQGFVEDTWPTANTWCYEHFIMAANETGRDLHFNFPSGTDLEWFTKFAKLVQYGSDGFEPYDGPVANPVYPPLNPNLRIILEHGNEMGWSAIQPTIWRTQLKEHATANNAIWQAINWDGRFSTGEELDAAFRYHAWRTAQMSLAMRAVAGASAIGERARTMLFGQYQQVYQNSMSQYLDDYFNNGGGNHVAEPLAVSEIIWGAGLAVYYGGENIWGESDTTWLNDRSFESFNLSPGSAVLAPASGDWTFTGNAGVANYTDTKTAAHSNPASGGTAVSDGKSVGFQFTTGSDPVFVYQLGRQNLDGSLENGIALYKADGTRATPNGRPGLTLSSADLSPSEETIGAWVYRNMENSSWNTSDSYRPAIYRLEPNTSYLLLCEEVSGDSLPEPVAVTAAAGITIDHAVETVFTDITGRNTITDPITVVAGSAGKAWPHLNFRFSTGIALGSGVVVTPPDPRGGPNFPDAGSKHPHPLYVQSGAHTAFIAGTGSIQQDITVTEAGEYFLTMTGSSQYDHENPLRVTIGAQTVWEDLGSYVFDGTLGQDRKPDNGYFTYATEYIALEPGTYTVTIEGTSASPTDVAYIDGVHIGTMDAYFGGPDATNFLGAGSATGQTDSQFDVNVRHASGMAQNWGVVPTTYEGGNSVGGDWNGGGSLFWEQSKWYHPYTQTADLNAANRWFFYGGHQFFHYYPPYDWEDYPNAENYVQWQASVIRAQTLDWEPGWGHPIPGTLTTEDSHYSGGIASTYSGYYEPDTSETRWLSAPDALAPGGWKSWRILVPSAGWYAVEANTTSGGNARLSVNEATPVASGSSGSFLSGHAFLTKGMHTVKVKCESGSLEVQAVTLTAAPDYTPTLPDAPDGLTANALTPTRIQLTWNDNSLNEAGYVIERRTGAGAWSTVSTTGINATSFTDSGLTGLTTYTYRVRAYNGIGTSADSNEAAATTPDPATSAPDQPDDLAATTQSFETILLTWTDTSAYETGYVIERRRGAGSFVAIATIGADATSFTDTGLTGDTTYTYRIAATNSYGTSPYTSEVAATTGPAPTPELLIYEAFDYAAGDLTTQAGGIWSDLGTLGTGDAREVTTPGLTFDDLPTAGNQLTYTGTTFGNTRPSGVTTGIEDRPVYYASAVFRSENAGFGGGTAVIGVSLANETSVGGNAGLAFGLLGNLDGESNIRPFISIDRLDQSTSNLTDATPTGAVGGTNLTADATYLLVAKWVITDTSANTADLFLNVYDLAAGVPTTESYTLSQTGVIYGWPISNNGALDTLGTFKNNTGGVASVDEIRYGATWGDVVPTAGATFATWAAAIDWQGADSSPTVVVSPLGVANLTLYALDISDPFAADTSKLPTVAIDELIPGGPWLTFTYRHNPAATDLTYTVRESTDLVQWDPLPIDDIDTFLDTLDPDPDGDGSAQLLQIRTRLSPTDTKGFLYLNVTQP